jgi:hypothetical protein
MFPHVISLTPGLTPVKDLKARRKAGIGADTPADTGVNCGNAERHRLARAPTFARFRRSGRQEQGQGLSYLAQLGPTFGSVAAQTGRGITATASVARSQLCPPPPCPPPSTAPPGLPASEVLQAGGCKGQLSYRSSTSFCRLAPLSAEPDKPSGSSSAALRRNLTSARASGTPTAKTTIPMNSHTITTGHLRTMRLRV